MKVKPPFSVGQHCVATLTLDDGVVQKPVLVLRVYELFTDSGVFNYWVGDDNGDKHMVDEDHLKPDES